jgi:hypothetical protein
MQGKLDDEIKCHRRAAQLGSEDAQECMQQHEEKYSSN